MESNTRLVREFVVWNQTLGLLDSLLYGIKH
jgi:hypothetical protein